MKTYVITLSKKFLFGSRKGEETNFKDKFLVGEKIHTIRANYPLWEKRIGEVQEGKAILSIREWSGKPYNSKQVVIKDLIAKDGVGIELYSPYMSCISPKRLAKNDGLTLEELNEWFKDYDLSQPLAIIHFTSYRYKQRSK